MVVSAIRARNFVSLASLGIVIGSPKVKKFKAAFRPPFETGLDLQAPTLVEGFHAQCNLSCHLAGRRNKPSPRREKVVLMLYERAGEDIAQ
jgi:hypothetical protein